MSVLQTEYSRKVYNGLDWLGDVGGLKDGFFLIGHLLMFSYTLIVGNPLIAFILSTLFKTKRNPSTRKYQSQS